MKTLIVTLEYPPQIGGIANYVYNYALLHPDVTIIAPRAKGDKEFDALHPWKVIRTSPFTPFIWPHWLGLFLTVRSVVKREGITDVMVHHVLPVGYIVYFLRKFVSYTLFLHGTDIALATKQKRKVQWFQKICNNAKKIIVNSNFLERRVREYVETTPVAVVHPCPSAQFFQPAVPEELESLRAHLALSGKKVLITVGRMVDGKGFPHCVSILPKLLQKIPNIVWLMVGNGPKRNDIIALVQKYNLQNAVRFLGEIAPADLPSLYQVADAFVLLTHPDDGVEEGFGTVLLEAAASGLPAVAGRSGGVEEAVVDGEGGHVVDTYQEEQVIAAITHVIMNTDEAKAMGVKARARVHNEFTWDKQFTKL